MLLHICTIYLKAIFNNGLIVKNKSVATMLNYSSSKFTLHYEKCMHEGTMRCINGVRYLQNLVINLANILAKNYMLFNLRTSPKFYDRRYVCIYNLLLVDM